MVKYLLTALCACLATAADVRAGWGSGGCTTLGTVVPTFNTPHDYRSPTFTGWAPYKGNQYHYTNGVEDAAYDPQMKVFRTLDPRTQAWSPPQPAPWLKAVVTEGLPKRTVDCKCKECKCSPCRCVAGCKCEDCKCHPCNCKAEEKPVDHVGTLLFGVDTAKLNKDGTAHYSINGVTASRQEAVDAVDLADDSTKPYVTFVGPNREKIEKAFAATPEAAKCRVNSYAADEWYTRPGFVTNGTPTIYVQNAKGEVLYRADTDPGLDTLVAEVRKAQPDYDPSKDPNGTADLLAVFKKLPGYAWLLVGGVVIMVLHSKKDK